MSWQTGPAGTEVGSGAVAYDGQGDALLQPQPIGLQAEQPQDAAYGGPLTAESKLSALASLPAAQVGPSYRLTVHGIDGSLRTASSVAPLVRMHVVDIDTGNWRWKEESRLAVYNVDAAGQPYLRHTERRQEPWQADVGRFGYIRPFSTEPCLLQADRSGVVRTPAVWEEEFLITAPLHQDTMLLFEVLNYVEEGPRGPQLVGLAWAFLDVDRAFALNRGHHRRLRLQLHRYRRSRLGMGWFSRASQDSVDWLQDQAEASVGLPAGSEVDDSRDRPRVYSELRRPARPISGTESGLVRRLARSTVEMLFSGRHLWPAVLEISLEQVPFQGDLDKVAATARHQELPTKLDAGPTSTSPELAPATAGAPPGAAAAGEAPGNAAGKDLSQEEKSCLASYNKRYPSQPCDLPTELQWQIPTGERGATRLSVSPSGQLLAVAVSRRSGSAELRIFRITTGRVHAVCTAAHDAMVYDMCWHAFSAHGGAVAARRNLSPQLLISCSRDGVVQLYEVSEDLRTVDELGRPMPSNPLLLRPHATLYLPSHVYSVRPHPALSANPAQIVLACGGHGFGLMICKVSRERIPEGFPEAGRWRALTPHWQERVRLENPGSQQPPPQQADVLCVRFSTQPTSPDNLYVTDAAGHVSLFQVRFEALEGIGGSIRAVFVRHYMAPELVGVPIYALDVITPHLTQGKRFSRPRLANADDWVLIYGRDHIIRLASLQRGTLSIEQKYTGHESGNYQVRGSMSPDGAYIACGSETGEVFVWNAADGKAVSASAFPEVQLAGPVMDTVWSEHHHMVACCALDDEAPPVLVFVGGDPYRAPPKEPPRPPEPLPVLQPSRHPLPLDDVARDLQEQLSLVPKSIAPSGIPAGDWAARWLNSNENPNSQIKFDEKRQLKEKILSHLLDRKGAAEGEQLFAAVDRVPGGIV